MTRGACFSLNKVWAKELVELRKSSIEMTWRRGQPAALVADLKPSARSNSTVRKQASLQTVVKAHQFRAYYENGA
jgi:hypothetical protein